MDGNSPEGGEWPAPGALVRLHSLKARPELNGASARVLRRAMWTADRVAVHLLRDRANGRSILVRPANLSVFNEFDDCDTDADDGAVAVAAPAPAVHVEAHVADGGARPMDEEVSVEEDGDETDSEGLSMIADEMIATAEARGKIYANMKRRYYVALTWAPHFYIDLAWSGFVSVAHEYNNEKGEGEARRALLLPEMQLAYGFIDLERTDAMHVGKKVRKRSRTARYSLGVNQNLEEVVRGIDRHHDGNWLCHTYCDLWRALTAYGPVNVRINGGKSRFQAVSIELLTAGGEVAAGEVGYVLGSTYTSLTGYFNTAAEPAGPDSPPGAKPRLLHSSAGKIQMLALGALLRRCGVRVWNLGHPPKMPTEDDPKGAMVYKAEIGGTILDRHEFLQKWADARDDPILGHGLPVGQYPAFELIQQWLTQP